MNTPEQELEARAELSTTRLCLSWALAALVEPTAIVSMAMLVDALERAQHPTSRTLRCLAFVAADALSDRLFGEHAYSAACALAVLDPHQS